MLEMSRIGNQLRFLPIHESASRLALRPLRIRLVPRQPLDQFRVHAARDTGRKSSDTGSRQSEKIVDEKIAELFKVLAPSELRR